jgi:outer membrane receptor protein involved in Fe transport
MFKQTVASLPLNRHACRSRYLISAAVAAAIAGTSMPAGAQESGGDAGLTEVTITGSRIVRRDLEASSPVVTVDTAALENQSTIGVESALNSLPQFKPAGTQFVAGDVQASAFNNPGISSVNLRGLGANRNLVLVDGRRAQPANATLVVDVNSIPAAAIENVEIISGGASAVYGADAIAGVVNFKLKRNFQGLVIDGQSSVTEEGDGFESRMSALLGGNFAEGAGNVMVGLEWSKREGVLQADRDFYVNGWEDPNTTGGALTSFTSYAPVSAVLAPSQAAVNSVFGTTGTAVNRTTNFYFNRDGSLFKQSPARRFNSMEPGIKLARNNALAQPDRTPLASSPLDRYSIFARGNFTFNDHVSAFIQGNLSSIHVEGILGYAPATSFWGAPVPRDAAHPVPTELAVLLDSRTRANPSGGAPISAANEPWQVERVLDFVGPRSSTNDSTVYQVLAGLQGDLGLADWTWEAYVSHGQTSIKNVLSDGFVSLDRWRTLIAAPNYGRGFSYRDPNLGYAVSCTSGLPIFQNFEVSQDCIDAISIRMKNVTDLSQDIVEANLQGGLFDLPAGEVRAAAGFTHRINKFTFDPDTLNDQEQIADAPIGLFAANDTNGSTRVNELYAELLIPVLKDLPGIRELSLELGGRHSRYDRAGGIWTYKALANWSVASFLNFRGGYQLANRAPNTAELFTGPTVTVAGFPLSDPCAITTRAPWGNVASNPNRARVQALCSALNGTGTSVFDFDPNGFIGGNGGFFPLELENRRGNSTLVPEEAKTVTVGAVFRAPFESAALSGLTAAVDWYSIKIDDAISPLPSTTVYENCFNVNGVSNPTYSLNDPGGFCSMIKRDGVTGGRVSVDAPYLNLGSIETQGIDMQVNWRAAFADIGLQGLPGTLSAGISVNYLLSFKTQNTPVAPFVENEGTLAQAGQYQYVGLSNLGYSVGDWNFGMTWRYLPAVDNAARATNPTATPQGAHSYSLFDLTASWAMTDTVAFRLGIDNLLDRDPEVVGFDPGVTNANGTTNAGYYGVLGRRMYLGVKLNF